MRDIFTCGPKRKAQGREEHAGHSAQRRRARSVQWRCSGAHLYHSSTVVLAHRQKDL
jgi:hypothetical protein